MVTERKNKVCKICGGEIPAGSGRYNFCSEKCNQVGTARRDRARRDKLLAACKSCGGEKEPGTRGGKLCQSCREKVADATRDRDRERHRRARLQEVTAAIERGEAVVRHAVPYRDGDKWCPRCQDYRPVSSFPVRKGNGKPSSYCTPCQRAYNSERRLKLHFGLDWDDYEMLLATQGYACAICGGKPRKYMLAVDHDHQTGEIRGLLCSRCNHKLLGSANDDPARLRKAADYLERFAPRDVFGEPRYVPGSDV